MARSPRPLKDCDSCGSGTRCRQGRGWRWRRGTVAFYVARQLARLELVPVVVDAHEVRLKAHRPMQKRDRRDAFELCEGLRRDIYRTIVHVPTPAISLLRETLSRRRHFVRVQTPEINAAKRLLRAAGMVKILALEETLAAQPAPIAEVAARA